MIKLLILQGNLYVEYSIAAQPDGTYLAPPKGWIPDEEKPDTRRPWAGWKPVGLGPNEARIRTAWRRFLREKPRRVMARNGKTPNLAVGRKVENGHYILKGGEIVKLDQP